MHGSRRRRLLAGLLTSVSALSLLVSGAAANPEGGAVAAGTVTITHTAPGTLEIHQTTDKAIINWRSFSIGANEHTQFRQPSAAAIALNRVTGGDPSQILGRLSANGQLILVNPNGVLFGRNATVDVAGLIATTSNIRDQNFLAGRLEFTQPGLPGRTVVNHGGITVGDGGLAALVAPGVENSGHIVARLGRIALASGDRFTVDLYGDGLINLTMDDGHTQLAAADGAQIGARVTNSGLLSADGGHVVLAAATVRDIVDNTINMDGVVEARSFAQQGGRITLFGGEAGTVRVAGRVDASTADGSGGAIDIFGEHIVLAGTADVQASGAAAGGTIRIGGDVQGQTAEPTATTNQVQAGATIAADATAAGDGGTIVVWSDGTTSFFGGATARGGQAGGDGGFIEVSGKQQLAFAGQADTSAPHGQTGELLLDPTSIDICSGCTTGGAGTANSQLNVNDLVANLNANNVTVSTNSTAAGDGDIDVNARIRWLSGNDLHLTADRNINVNQNIEARAQSDITLAAGGNVEMTAGRRITTVGGNTEVNGQQVTLQRIQTRGNSAVANGGNVTVNATGDVVLAQAIDARGSTPLTGTGGDVIVTAARDLTVAGSIHTTARGADAGSITLTSQNGAVLTADNATLNARAESGGNGGNVTVSAENGLVRIGAANRSGTRIDTRGLGSATRGGSVLLTGATVVLNRDISTSTGITGNAGQVTINATGEVTTRSIGARGGRTTGQGGAVDISAGGDITATGAIDTAGYTGDSGSIRVASTGGDVTSEDNASFRGYALQGGNGGDVTLEATTGSVTLGRTLGRGTRIDTRGRGTGATGSGGNVTITAQTVTLNRDINAGGSVGGNGGAITVTASSGDASLRSIATRGGTSAGQGGNITVTATGGNVTVHGNVDANGNVGDAGNIAIQSVSGSIAMRDTAFLNARGLRGGNSGTISLTAAQGDITVGDTIRNSTHILTGAGGAGATGNGGNITISARNVTLNRGIGANGSTGGNGGDVSITATAGTATTRGIAARGGTTAGQGGDITVSASADVTANGNLDAAGYTGDAGAISVTSNSGSIASADNASFRAQGLRGGNGGNVSLNAANGTITLGQTSGNGTRIDARGLGPGATGNGGDVELTAQALTLNRAIHTSGASGGDAGQVTLTATNGAATIRGIAARGGTTSGKGGQINVSATGNIETNSSIDASANTGNAGSVSLVSQVGSILTGDRASIAARGLRGGNAGSVSLTAANGDIRIGATTGNSTQLLANAGGTGSAGNGGTVTLRGQNVTLNRSISVAGAAQGNGGSVAITATTGQVTARTIAARGGTTSGRGGTINVTATGDIALNTSVDASGYAANAGTITVTSSNGSIGTADSATISARGNRGGNGGTITMQASNGSLTVGGTAGGGTRITTRGNASGGTIQLQAGAVTLNRNIETRGGTAGGAATIAAATGNALLRNIDTRGSGTKGAISVSAAGDITSAAGTVRGGATTLGAGGAIGVTIDTDSLQIGGDSAAITGRINGQSRAAAVNELQIINTNIPDPCTVNAVACILPPPPPPPAAPEVVAAPVIPTDVTVLAAAIDQADSPLPLRFAEQETPGQEAFVQSPLIDAVPVDIFSGGYRLVTTDTVLPAAGNDEPAEDTEAEDTEEGAALTGGNDTILPAAGPASSEPAAVPVDPYFTQDVWSGVRNP